MDVEARLRNELKAAAEQADVSAPVVARAIEGAAVKRRQRWLTAGAAAAAVVLVAGLGVWVAGHRAADSGGDPDPAPVATDSETTPPGIEMRTEYWRGISIDVPRSWAWGSTPGVCSDGEGTVPYVGRPIGNTDACVQVDPSGTPRVDYVWLGDDLPVGTTDLGGGFTREVVRFDGVSVAVATRDPALRALLLGSLRAQDLCAAHLDGVPVPVAEGTGNFMDGHLCAYRRARGGAGFDLVYARPIEESEFMTSVETAESAQRQVCRSEPDELVLLSARLTDVSNGYDWTPIYTRELLYEFTCGVVVAPDTSGGAATTRRVTEATVPWATEEFKRLLIGPTSDWAYQYFIGIQG